MKRLFVLIVLLSFVGACSCIRSENNDTNDMQGEPIQAALMKVEISPNAEVVWSTLCKACGHLYEYSSSEQVIGLTKEELLRRFSDWTIKEFSREYVHLYREIEGYCPDHYIAKLEGNSIRIYSIVEPELIEGFLLEFDASPYELGPLERIALKKGIAFSSLIEIDKYTDLYRKGT